MLLACLLGLGHLLLFLGAGPVDDDFICYRYARNLVRGDGLVYQAGERVEGFTNPLWVLLHAGGNLFLSQGEVVVVWWWWFSGGGLVVVV